MNRVAIATLYAIVSTLFFLPTAIADELQLSGKNWISDNPFIAYGVNPKTNVITGYLIGLRTAPGRTDECRFVFAGNLKNRDALVAKYLSEIKGYEEGGSTSRAVAKGMDSRLVMRIKKDRMGGDCEWILPFVGEPRVDEADGEVLISFGDLMRGGWIGVFAIRTKRAMFHKTTKESSAKRAFLIQGDLIYVYDEKPGWYYVKYEEGKKATEGWIKKSDTVQIDLSKSPKS
jgi:hypothetical protein